MGGLIRRTARMPDRRTARPRKAALLTATVASLVLVTAAAVLSAHHRHATRAVTLSWSRAAVTLSRESAASTVAAGGNAARRLGLSAKSAATAAQTPGPGPLVLTARDRRLCPRAATACVDLTRHLTWLQSRGGVTVGPVLMEPGPPGTVHATPRGTFQVSWKTGPDFMSSTYHEPMPWAVFFAPGGVAFHGGSLTTPSHGCVHLTVANARYYNEHLPVGAEVVVF